MKVKLINPNFFGWDNKVFRKEEKEYRAKEREFNSSVDWLNVFPDAKKYIYNRYNKLTIEINDIKIKFEKHLTLIDLKYSGEQKEKNRFFISILYLAQIRKKTEQLKILTNTAKKNFYTNKHKNRGSLNKGFSPENIEEARNISIVSLFEHDSHILKRSGNNLITLCPFHNESTPSCTIYCNENRYYCYGCNAKGNSIDYLMTLHQLTFSEAMQELIGTRYE